MIQRSVYVLYGFVVKIVRGIAEQSQRGAVHLAEHGLELLHGTDDVVHVVFNDERAAPVLGILREILDDIDGLLEDGGVCVLVVPDPVALGVEGAGLARDIRAAEVARVAQHHLEKVDVCLAFDGVGMDDVRVAGHGDDGQIRVSKRVPNPMRLLLGERFLRCVEVLKGDVELNAVEIARLDAADDFVQSKGVVSGEDTDADHGVILLLYGKN